MLGNKKSNLCQGVFIALLAATGSTHAAVLEEVVVTAQKREQNLQDVGIAITAFTGEQMKALGFENSFDIADFTPGVHVGGAMGGLNLQYTIRGVTQNDFNDIVESPNAVYLDDGYIASSNGQTFALFDIDRVEILKGPQGTLFGRNATGGLVHYHSKQPTFETESYIDTTFGYFDSEADALQQRIEGAMGGALSENVAARAAFLYNHQDGYLKNNYPQFTNAFTGASPGPGAGSDLGGDETLAGRLTFLAELTDQLTTRVSANISRSDVDTGPYQSKSTIGVFNATPTLAAAPFSLGGLPAGITPVPGTGELINVIETPANETRLSIVQGTALDGGADPSDVGFFSQNAFGSAGTSRPVPGGDFSGYNDPDGGGFTTSGDFAFEDQGFVDAEGVNGNVQYELSNGMEFTGILDYKNFEKLLFIDVDSGPLNSTANYAGVDQDSFTAEFRLSGETNRSRWVTGFYYLNIDTDSDNGLKVPQNSTVLFDSTGAPTGTNILFFGGLAPTSGVDLGTDAQLETNSYSIFGQIEFDLTEELALTAGLRVIQEEKDYNLAIGVYESTSNFRINQGGYIPVVTPSPTAIGVAGPAPGTTLSSVNPALPAFSFQDSSSDTLWTGKAQLDWRPNDDLLLYAGINRGVKAGSFNAPLIGSWVGASLVEGNSFIPYKEEVLLAYEGGFKYSMFDNTTRVSGSVFYYDYTDYQAFLFTGIGGNVINADAENIGVEFDIQTSPMAGLDAVLAFAWFDATVKDVPLRIGSSIVRDVDPTYAPEVQLSGLVRYEWPMFGGMMNVRGDFTYSDEFFYNLRNFDADKFDSYVIFNTGLGWTSNDGTWETNFSVRNVTDEEAGVLGFDLATACGCNEESFQPPRWFGLNIRYNF